LSPTGSARHAEPGRLAGRATFPSRLGHMEQAPQHHYRVNQGKARYYRSTWTVICGATGLYARSGVASGRVAARPYALHRCHRLQRRHRAGPGDREAPSAARSPKSGVRRVMAPPGDHGRRRQRGLTSQRTSHLTPSSCAVSVMPAATRRPPRRPTLAV